MADALAADPKTAQPSPPSIWGAAATAIATEAARFRPGRAAAALPALRANAARVVDRAAADALMGPWRDGATQAARFEALLALDTHTRAAVLAEAVAALATAQTAFEPDRSGALETAIARLQPRWRAAWTPDAAFFAQLTREKLLEIGEQFGGSEWTHAHQRERKDEVAAAVAALFDEAAEGTAEWTPAGFEPETPPAAAGDDGAAEMPAFLDKA